MKLIVGLGNIGKEFEQTNHNAGFMVVDRVAEQFNVKFNKRGCEADYLELSTPNGKVIIAKPRTYMNSSGRAVKSLCRKFSVSDSDVLVVVDDIDQPVGNIRIRKNGSAGTHNGLRSIVQELGSEDFARVRVGIGGKAQQQDLADFVLSKMRLTKAQKLGIENATQAVVEYIGGQSLEELMAHYNGNANKNGTH